VGKVLFSLELIESGFAAKKISMGTWQAVTGNCEIRPPSSTLPEPRADLNFRPLCYEQPQQCRTSNNVGSWKDRDYVHIDGIGVTTADRRQLDDRELWKPNQLQTPGIHLNTTFHNSLHPFFLLYTYMVIPRRVQRNCTITFSSEIDSGTFLVRQPQKAPSYFNSIDF